MKLALLYFVCAATVLAQETPTPTPTATPDTPVIITFTPDLTVRLQATIKKDWRLDHNPSNAEMKSYFISMLRSQVQRFERDQYNYVFVPISFDPQ